MAGGRDCAMFFFTNDWMGDANVQAMTWEQRGMYHWLLCLAWNEGGIPADEDALRGILGLTKPRFRNVWPAIARCWRAGENGKLLNPRLEQERAVRASVSEKRAAAGRRGGKQAGDWDEARAKQTGSKL